jgi:hypothetical protein
MSDPQKHVLLSVDQACDKLDPQTHLSVDQSCDMSDPQKHVSSPIM